MQAFLTTLNYDIATEITPNGFVCTEDDWKRVDKNGMSDAQSYEFTPNPNGRKYVFKKAKNGLYTQGGRNGDTGCIINHREYYFDFSF